jgi:hypothetical protein
MSCRLCRTPKWKGDLCANPDCTVNTQVKGGLRARTKPITATVKHGYHALNQQAIAAGYDAPIRNDRWITVGR